MRQSCRLCDLIPEVLNVAIPELPYLGLVRGTSCAGDESKTFERVEGQGVLLAGQWRRRTGTKCIGVRKSKRCDAWPLDEIRRREVGWRQLIASRLVFRHEGRKDSGRSIVASQRQNCSGYVLTLLDAVGFVASIRNLCQILLKLRVECRGEGGIERDENIMGSLVCCCLSGSPSRGMRVTNRIRLEVSVDVVDGVKDSSMQHGEAASGMDRRRLGARRPHDRQQSPVPFDDRVHRLSGRGGMIVMICCCGAGGTGDGSPETST